MKKTLLAVAMMAAGSQAYAGVCYDISFGGSTVASGGGTPCTVTGEAEQVFMDSGVGYTVFGHVGSQTDPRIVQFDSTDVITANEGFAQITGGFTDLTFGMESPLLTMDAVQFDVRFTDYGGTNQEFGLAWSSTLVSQTIAPIDITEGGLYTVTIVADPESLVQVGFNTLYGVEVANFKHLRIDPDSPCVTGCDEPNPTSVSAPGSLALLSFGLIGLALARRKSHHLG